MEARQIIRNASFRSDELKAIEQAFDQGWARIAPIVGNRPEAVRAASIKLADILLNLARGGNFDPQWLADTAVQLMLSRASRFQP